MREAWGRFLEANRGRFSLLLPVSMGAAILVYFALPSEPASWIGPAAMLVAAVVLAAGWRYPPARFAAFLVLAAALGFAHAEERTAAQPPLWHFAPGPAGITGTVTDILHLPGGDKIVLASPSIRHGPVQARTLHIRLRDDDPAVLNPGSRISVYAMLFGPERPAYPGAWDFARQAYFDDLGASGFALGKVEIVQPAPPDAAFLATLRGHIASTILATLPPDTGSIAVTLLTGGAEDIPAQEHKNFIAAGLAHILAVAGLHVGIVMGIFFFCSRFLLARSEWILLRLPVKAIAAIAALAGGAGYAALTGAHLPILRSLAMASLVTLGVLAGRRAISLRGLALAAAILLAATPETILGVSFQMSFSAVLALIAGYAAAQNFFLQIHHKFLHHVLTLTFTSLLAGGASMPFAAYQFQQIEPYWIPANLIAVPLTALWIMPWGLAALALMPFGLAPLALIPMGWGIGVIVWAATEVAAWPQALMSLPLIPASAILAYSAGLIWLCLWRTRIRFWSIAAFILAVWLATSCRPPDVLVSADARLIAVRQGDKILLLRLPKASGYTLSEWAPMFLNHKIVPITCGPLGCPLGAVLLTMAPPASCGTARLVISPEPLRGACAALPRIDRLTTWQNGATVAWLTPLGPRLLTDRDMEGDRPWVMPWPEE